MHDAERIDDWRAELERGGLRGSFLVRDLRTGEELGIDPDRRVPIASVVKIALAVATEERIRRGEIDPAARVLVQPGRVSMPGPTGTSRFRHPSQIAVDDLQYLSVALSDGNAADALLDITPPEHALQILDELGITGFDVRHRPGELAQTVSEQLGPEGTRFAQSIAVQGATPGQGHSIPQLDIVRANMADARALADLLEAIWRPTLPEPVATRVRELMLANVHRTRLAPEFVSDSSRWWSKTGTILTFRHEVGVVEHEDGSAFAVVALTESVVAASEQPAAEALMGAVARSIHDEVRRRSWG